MFGFAHIEPEQQMPGVLPFLHPLFSASGTAHIFDSFRQFQEQGKLRILKRTHEYPSRHKASRLETGNLIVKAAINVATLQNGLAVCLFNF